MEETQNLIARARKSYRTLDGVIVVSPRLVKDLADALEARPSTQAAALKEAKDMVEELRIEDELADGFRSRNGDPTLQDAIAALSNLIVALS